MLNRSRSRRRLSGPGATGPSQGSEIGNIAVMLDLLKPLQTSHDGSQESSRRLLADLCRLVGSSVGATPPPSPPPPEPPALTGLSPRQSETLAQLLRGQSEKEAAQALGVSVHTVHVYVKALYRRFGVSSRAELLAHHMRPSARAIEQSKIN